MFEMSEATIEAAMPRISSGLEKYFSLQTAFPKTDVTKDREFKRNFNGFYRVRRGADWQRSFYDLLEQQKKCPQSFVDVLTALHSRTGRVEASFVSKLIATANPDQPVIDKFVLINLNLRLPPATSEVGRRISDIEEIYNCMSRKLSDFLNCPLGHFLTMRFGESYPHRQVTRMKMLDLVLWQTRK